MLFELNPNVDNATLTGLFHRCAMMIAYLGRKPGKDLRKWCPGIEPVALVAYHRICIESV